MKSLANHLMLFLLLFVGALSIQAQTSDNDNRLLSDEELDKCRIALLPIKLIMEGGEPNKDTSFALKIEYIDDSCHPFMRGIVPTLIEIRDLTHNKNLWKKLPISPFKPDSMIPEYWTYDRLTITSTTIGNIEVSIKRDSGVRWLFVAYPDTKPMFMMFPNGQDVSTVTEDDVHIIEGTNQDFIQFMNIWAGTNE